MTSVCNRPDGRGTFGWRKFGAAAVLLVLLVTPVSAFGLAGQTQPNQNQAARSSSPRAVGEPDPYTERIPHNVYYYFPFDNPYDASVQLQFQVASTVALDVYVMSQSQFAAFKSSSSTVAFYHDFGTTVSGSTGIPAGSTSYLVVWNDASQTTAVATISGSTNPVDVTAFYSGPPAPVGLADYGVEDYAGSVISYVVTTSEVVGNAKISTLGAYNATPPAKIDADGATLQLNVMLGVNTTRGQYVYWLQDVATFRTNLHTVYFQSEIFNESVTNANLSSSYVSGKGRLLQSSGQNTYIFDTATSQYSFPYFAEFVVSESVTSNGVSVRYGYATSSTSQPSLGSTIYFDTVAITEPGSVSSSAIVVDGNKLNPVGAFYDAEFVFCGEGNGEVTTFTQMNSVLSLSYLGSGGGLTQPKSIYEFGSDTAESAYNLQTSFSGGTFTVSLGAASFHQDYVLAAGPGVPLTFSYSVVGGAPAGANPPLLTYTSGGAQKSASLTSTPTVYFMDNGSSWSVSSSFPNTSSERWFAAGTNGTVSSATAVSLVYNHQYLLTTVGLTTTTLWENAGTQVQQNVQEIVGRANGAGYRVASASLDGGSPQVFPLTTGTVPVNFTMNSPHTLTLTLVKQYQVALQGDTVKALNTITSPTISGDQYWYDAGSQVNVILNGAWGRDSGSGSRLASYSVDGASQTSASTLGTIAALSVSSISSSHSIAGTVVSQFQLSTPTGSVSSITSPSIASDAGWYDSGTSVTVTYASVWSVFAQQSRLAARGYAIDGGAVTAIGNTVSQTFSVSVTMGAPHHIDVKAVIQYFVRFDVTDAAGVKKLNYSSIQISFSGQTQNVTGEDVFLDNSTAFTISGLTYEGVDVNPQVTNEYTVSGPVSVQVKALVYDATLKVTDLLGFPVSGASVKMTLINGSVISGATGGDGTFTAPAIPLGNYTASVVALGSSARVAGDASKQAVATAGVLFSTTSLALIVVVIAAAIVLALVAVRRRKAPGAPEAAKAFKPAAVCPNCGANISESEGFCTNCGAKLEREPKA